MKRIEGVDEKFLDLEGKEMNADRDGKEKFTYKKAFINLIGTARGKDANENVEIYEMGKELGKSKKDWEVDESRNQQAILERIVQENKVGDGQYPGYIIGALIIKIRGAVAFKKDK